MPHPVPVLLMVRELGIGGCERDLTRLALQLDRNRFEPHVCATYPDGMRRAELEAAGVPIFRLTVRSLFSSSLLSGARELGRYCREHGIEIIHAFDAPTNLLGIPIGRCFRVPVVIASHLWRRDTLAAAYRVALSLIDRLSDGVIVNSESAGKELADDYHVPLSRIHLCYNGVDTGIFRPNEDRTSSRAQRPLVIGTVCALRPEKRLDLLLSAFAKVRSTHAGIRLVVVGSGIMLGPLEKQCEHLGVEDVSHFEPTTTNVADWMRQIDIFVLCSATESFPNALLEAMSCGCCVVGSRVGGVPELIEEGQSGLLFEPGDADELAAKISLVADHEDLRITYGLNAALRAKEHFPVERSTRAIEEIYMRLLKENRPE